MSPITAPGFSCDYRVLYGDTDAGGVVYNANFLRLFEISRTELMRNRACSYREIEEQGLIMPVTECFARYKAPAFYDDLLILESSIVDLTRYTCKFKYKITRQDPDRPKPTLLVKGYTIHAAVTREGKLIRIPDTILAKLQPLVVQLKKSHDPKTD